MIKWTEYSVKIGKETILDSINLHITKGQMVAIVGKSGEGKTTLLNSILGFYQNVQGELRFNNKVLSTISKKKQNQELKKVGYLTQETNLVDTDNIVNNIKRSLNFNPKIWQNWFGFLNRTQREEVFDAINQVGLLEKSFIRVNSLSGGQKQRVEIAKILINNCSLMLADEPTSSLDFYNATEVISKLKDLNKSKDMTIVVVLHDLDLALDFFDEIILVKNKKIQKLNPKKINKKDLLKLIDEKN